MDFYDTLFAQKLNGGGGGSGNLIDVLQSVPGGSATVTLELKDGYYYGDIDWIDPTFDTLETYLYVDSFEITIDGNTYSFTNEWLYLNGGDMPDFYTQYDDNTGHYVITIDNPSAITVDVSWSATNVYKPSAEVMSTFPIQFPANEDDH